MNPLFRIDFSISDSLKIVRKSVLIYETIISGHQYVSLSLCLPRQTVDDIVFSSGKQIKVPDMHPSEIQAEFFLLK